MNALTVSPLLRFALRLDALGSASAGVLASLLASPLATTLGVDPQRVLAVGVFMLGYGALVGWLGLHSRLPLAWVWSVVIGNSLWVLASVALVFSDWIAPTAVGLALVLTQAAAVAVFAELQYLGLRRSLVQTPA